MSTSFTPIYPPTISCRLLCALLLLLPVLGHAQAFTGTYPFSNVTSGSSGSGTTDPTPVPTATGVTFGSFSAVGTSANSNAGGRFSFTSWPTGATDGSDTFTGAPDLGKYYTVTLTPQPGFVLSLSSITFTLQRTTTGIRQYAVRSSADNYATNLPASISPTNANLSVAAGNIFQVVDATTSSAAYTGSTVTLGGTGFTNVSGAVTFRFYGFNAEATSGTFSLDDVKITGTATATNAPTINDFTPAAGPVGTTVTITGTYFTASTTVAFNGVAATGVAVASATTLTATVPSGATTGPLTVGTSGGTVASAASYTVTVPTVAVSPSSLAGFGAAVGAPSAAQTYQVSGSALNGNSLVITPSNASFEVSLDGSSYAGSASIALGGSPTLAPTTVYVRLASATATGSPSGTIANTNGTVTTTVAVSGAVVAPLAARRWTGAAGTASWFDAANWEGNTVPGTGDDVVLDHRYVAGKYTVALSSGVSVAPSAVTVNSLRIRPAAGDSILVVIPATNTISTSATGAPALTLARAAAGDTALYIATKGAFINLSGATAGDVFDPSGSNPTVFLLNGGSFYHRTLRGNTVLVENLSGAPGTETGNFFFRIPGSSTTISGSARTYGNLIFQRGGATSYGTSGTNTFTINGTLTIESGVTFLVTINGTTILKGNLANAGNFQLKAASATANGRRLVLQGTTPQVLSGTALGDPAAGGLSYLGTDAQLEINNPTGVTLQTPITLSSTLVLTSGLLTTTATNLLTLAPAATVSAGGAGSFVSGPVARTIPSVSNAAGVYSSYTFPVGKGTSFRPITLNINTQSSNTTYRAEQFEGDPGQNVSGSDLTRVSKLRWYTITPLSGGAVTQPSGFGGTVTLAVGAGDGVTDPTATTLVVGKRADATQPWANIGRSAAASTATGSTLTSAVFSSFSDFVLASTSDNSVANPLPVSLVSFTAVRQASGEVRVAWATASEQRSAYFEVQRSLDGQLFVTLEKVAASGTSTQTHHYASTDKLAPATKLYYRLRQTDTDGTATYSPVATVAASSTALCLYPNPAQQQLVVAAAAGQEVRVFDLAGRLRLAATLPASGVLPLDTLPAGTYSLQTVLAGQAYTARFSKY